MVHRDHPLLEADATPRSLVEAPMHVLLHIPCPGIAGMETRLTAGSPMARTGDLIPLDCSKHQARGYGTFQFISNAIRIFRLGL
jgi:hypothetical protein